tara:strand:+ start:107 stop:796 length:690 start_codon:yes stop_codon:yes gene_type:complete
MKILAIGAHPDDIEIFMYGLLAQCKNRGDEVNMIVATNGAAGKIKTDNNLKNIRKKEALNGLKNLGNPVFLDLPDGKLSYNFNAPKLIRKYLKKFSPDLVVTHAPEDYHPDHKALSIFVSECVGFKCGLIFADTLMGINFNPEIYIDISDVFEDKKKAIACHKSQIPEKFINAVKIWNKFRSSQCNGPDLTFAECYRLSKTFPFVDIRSKLPPEPKFRPFYSKNSEGLI